MPGRTGDSVEPTGDPPVTRTNTAQEERRAADQDAKKVTDTAQLGGGETWEHPSGHSGTRRSWLVSVAMIATFLLAGGGLTFGPRVLLWVGVGLFAALGVYSLAGHTWTDQDSRERPGAD